MEIANNGINADPKIWRVFCGLASLDFATKITPAFVSGYAGRYSSEKPE